MSIPMPPARSQLLRYGVRTPAVFRRDVVPSIHLAQLKRAIAAPANSASTVRHTIKVVGDSNATEAANNPLNFGANLYGTMLRAFRRNNPGVAFTNQGAVLSADTANYMDRAIGGATWAELATNTSRSGLPAWYTAPGQPWLNSFVGVSGGNGWVCPDVVPIAMGVNSAQFTSLANIRTVLGALCAGSAQFPTTPDVLFITNPGVTAQAPGQFNQAFQDGCLLGSSLVRSVARSYAAGLGLTLSNIPTTVGLRPIGLIDLARQDAMMRLGVDPCIQPMNNVLSNVTGITGTAWDGSNGYNLPQCYGDFYLRLRFPSQATTLFAGPRTLFVNVGSTSSSGGTPAFFCAQNSTLISSTYSNTYGTAGLTNTTLGSGDVRLEIMARQEWLRIVCQGVVIFDGPVCRSGWKFQPRVYFNASASNVTMTVEQYDAGTPLPVSPPISDAEMWGTVAGTNGNGLNHPSEFGLAHGVQTIFEQVDLCCL
jgi:hypothetical protein